MRASCLVVSCILIGFLAAQPASAQQGDPALEAVLQRLDVLDQQNNALRAEVEALRREVTRLTQAAAPDSQPAAVPPSAAVAGDALLSARLDALDEQMSLQAARLNEQDTVKAQSSQRVPVRFAGTLLFSLFRNSSHGVLAAQDYPVAARTDAAPPLWAGTLRRSVLGVEFETPEAIFGGHYHGSISVDLTEAGEALTNIQPKLRTATIEGRWKSLVVMVGQDKPIFSVREPTSLAQVQFAPLNGAGNFWLYRPQFRVEQTVALNPRLNVRARVGVSQAPETGGTIPPESRASVEPRSAALEGHVQAAFALDDVRRFEIGSGFHRSATQVLGTSVPADLVSLDWFAKPIGWFETTGAIFRGENMSKGGSSGFAQGHALITVRPGVFQPVPVARHGGWGQITVFPLPRLTINLHGGVDNATNDYLLPTSLTRNRALVFNTYYRLAPNVLVGFEVGNIRTTFKNGQHPDYTHQDLHVAYVF